MMADFIGDINGGDSFSDLYGLRRFLIGVIPSFTVLLLQKKLVMLPQTYGPYHSWLARFIARFIMSRASRLFSRDLAGKNTVNEILARSTDERIVEFCPDVAFTLPKTMPPALGFAPLFTKLPNANVVGLNINGLIYNGGYTRRNMFGLACDYKSFVLQLIRRFLQEANIHIILVPHTFAPPDDVNSDNHACMQVMGRIPKIFHQRLHLVTGRHDQSELKGIMNHC
jgi:hypothetical protein